MQKANFIGIGAQKCASTWLYGALAQFPDVYVSDRKEVDFFSYFYDHGYEWYERHFAEGAQRRFRGEVSPSYFISSDAPQRAHLYNRDLLILVTLRDPVERAYSNHLHEVRAGHLSGANLVFETAIENNPLYLNQGRYAHHLQRWFATFPREQIHVTFQEDVKADSLAQTRRLAAFMGTREPEQFVRRSANESVDYKNRAVGMMLWRLGKRARKAGLGAVVEQVKTLPGIRQMRSANQKSLRDATAPMRPETEAALVRSFEEDVRALESLLGTQVPWKRFRAS